MPPVEEVPRFCLKAEIVVRYRNMYDMIYEYCEVVNFIPSINMGDGWDSPKSADLIARERVRCLKDGLVIQHENGTSTFVPSHMILGATVKYTYSEKSFMEVSLGIENAA